VVAYNKYSIHNNGISNCIEVPFPMLLSIFILNIQFYVRLKNLLIPILPQQIEPNTIIFTEAISLGLG
jgi:hypothetical protein